MNDTTETTAPKAITPIFYGNLRYGSYTAEKPMPNIVGRYLYFKDTGIKHAYLTPNKLYKIIQQERNNRVAIQHDYIADFNSQLCLFCLNYNRNGHLSELGAKWILATPKKVAVARLSTPCGIAEEQR